MENAGFARVEIYTSVFLKVCSDTFHQPFCTLPESEQIYLGIKMHLNLQPLAQSDYKSSCHNMQKVSDFFPSLIDASINTAKTQYFQTRKYFQRQLTAQECVIEHFHMSPLYHGRWERHVVQTWNSQQTPICSPVSCMSISMPLIQLYLTWRRFFGCLIFPSIC